MPEGSTTPDLSDLTRRFADALNRRDFETLMSFFARDAVFDALFPEEHLRGRTAIRRRIEDWRRPYEEYDSQVEELLDLGDGVVFAVALEKGKLRGSNAVVHMRSGFVLLFDGDLLVRLTTSQDIDEARAAAERLAQERG
jgi:ketosteroid isomerase-like protein